MNFLTQTSNNKLYKAVVIGGSAGSFQVVSKILANISPNFDLPIVLCMHRLKHVRNGFVEALMIKSKKKIVEPEDKEPIKNNLVYLASSNYHLMLESNHCFALSTEEMINNSRPAIDITIDSVSSVYKDKTIGILLSGANKDGAQGMKKLKKRGGLTIVQDPQECTIATMPNAAISLNCVDKLMKTDEIITFLNSLV